MAAINPDAGPTRAGVAAIEDGPAIKRVSWGGIFAGTVVAMAVQILIITLLVGIGMVSLDPLQAASPDGATFSIAGAIGWLIAGVIAFVAGGWIAARLAGVSDPFDGMIHGLVTWGVTLLVSVWLVTSAVGSIASGAFGMISSTIGGAASAVTQAAPAVAESVGITPDAIERQVDQLLRTGTGQTDPQAARRELIGDLGTILAGGQGAEEAQQRAVRTIAQQAGISEQEAQARIQEVQQQAEQLRQQAEQTARETADAAASAAGAASFATFFALLVGAIAAAFGGRAGTSPVVAGFITRRTV